MRRLLAIYDACARASDYVAVPLVCAAILAPVFCGDWIAAIGEELFR